MLTSQVPAEAESGSLPTAEILYLLEKSHKGCLRSGYKRPQGSGLTAGPQRLRAGTAGLNGLSADLGGCAPRGSAPQRAHPRP